jgi:hypothetical protein
MEYRMNPRLENWTVVSRPTNELIRPKLDASYLRGAVHGRDGYTDGDVITTSAITAVSGRIVETRSGTTYELGVVHPDYAKFLSDNGLFADATTPLPLS